MLLLFLVYRLFEGVAGAPGGVHPLDEVSPLACLFKVVSADQGHDVHEYFGAVLKRAAQISDLPLALIGNPRREELGEEPSGLSRIVANDL